MTSHAATTKNRKVTVSSPNVAGQYKATLYVNGKPQTIGTTNDRIGRVKISKSMPITVNKNAQIYVRLDYIGIGKRAIASNIVKVTEQQLKTGFYTINVTVDSTYKAKLTLDLF